MDFAWLYCAKLGGYDLQLLLYKVYKLLPQGNLIQSNKQCDLDYRWLYWQFTGWIRSRQVRQSESAG